MSAGLKSLLPEPTNAWQEELLDDLDELDGSSKIIADESAPETGSVFGKVLVTQSGKSTGPSMQIHKAPPYLNRRHWIPRTPEDFGDGGSFPEIHVPQYPLKMGMKGDEATPGNQIVALEVDETGKIKYDAIVKQRMRKGAWMHSGFSDLVEKNPDPEELAKPDEDEVRETTEKTKRALEQLVNTRIQASKPTSSAMDANSGRKKGPTFLRYTPSQSGAAHNSGAKQRVVSLVEAQRDPLEPPKHRHKKVPGSVPSPPPPVQHSPPKKLSVQERQDWKIPACISNWKNPKGYTIPLDKRMAADGSGVQETSMNSNYALFVDALYIAERQAREEVRRRNELAKSNMLKQKQVQEDQLREFALKAHNANRDKERTDNPEVKQRDQIRQERKRDREDERRDDMKKSKVSRDRERDVSEALALGQAGRLTRQGESIYDSRLFNQDQGVGHTHEDDAYNIYEKPLMQGSAANQLYRPDKDRIAQMQDDAPDPLVDSLLSSAAPGKSGGARPDKGFSGANATGAGGRSRDRPVEFEKRSDDQLDDEEEADADPFDIEGFISNTKKK